MPLRCITALAVVSAGCGQPVLAPERFEYQTSAQLQDAKRSATVDVVTAHDTGLDVSPNDVRSDAVTIDEDALDTHRVAGDVQDTGSVAEVADTPNSDGARSSADSEDSLAVDDGAPNDVAPIDATDAQDAYADTGVDAPAATDSAQDTASENPCTDPSAAGPCDDGVECTVGDTCANGQCLPGPATGCDDANACTTDECQTGDGKNKGGCVHLVAPGPCDDGGKCTLAAACADGACIVTQTGIPKGCADGSACTKEACSPQAGCIHLAVPGPCDDANACTSSDTCSHGKCSGKPNTTANCDDQEPCTVDSCEPLLGCLHTDAEGACSDGDLCTENDGCSQGECVGQALAATACDDQNPCTEDGCDTANGCVNATSHGACDDGDVCTSNDACAGSKCVGTPLTTGCDDSNPCTVDACKSPAGCTHAADDAPSCTDGDDCTVDDACHAGSCAGVPVAATSVCDDANVCTSDICPLKMAKQGCIHLPAAATCDDANACTDHDECGSGACAGIPTAATTICDDGQACTRDRCDPAAKAGQICKHDPITALDVTCSDANGCTTHDVCVNGACVGAPLDVTAICDDGKACTEPFCLPEQGCANKPFSGACDDGDPCTGGDYCEQGECWSGDHTVCADGNPCTKDGCVAGVGCEYRFAAAPCKDDDPCTGPGTCVFGKCKSSSLDCDDANPCTTDACLPPAGCTHTAQEGACSDGEPCTEDGVCKAGKCASKLAADGSSCADVGACQAVAACKGGVCLPTKATPDGAPCDDADGCTVADTCTAGKCAGVARSCDDGDACTLDGCKAGACHHSATETALGCTDAGPCQHGVCDAATGECAQRDRCSPHTLLESSFECGKHHGFTLIPTGAEPQVGWHVDATPPAPQAKTGVCSLNFNDGKDYSNGKRVLGTATSAALALPHTATATLTFWSFHGVELAPQYDLRYVELSDDGFVDSVQRVRLSNGIGANAWARIEVDLSAWRRRIVQVRFRFDSIDGSSNAGPGWFIDDVLVTAAPPAGTCQTRCGAYAAAASCQCDAACGVYGDCCSDLSTTCGGCQDNDDCKLPDGCTTGRCRIATGSCVFELASQGAPCDDGRKCTTSDVCQSGVCHGLGLVCDDTDPCTADACAPTTGKCEFTPVSVGASCDDDNACTGPDRCAKSGCVGAPANCDDGNACTANACSAEIGCTVTQLTSACEDGSLCTSGDSCQSGACVPGKSVACDDANTCTIDVCDGKSGSCQHPNAPDGTACSGANTCIKGACAGGGICGNGKLEGGEQCDDGGTKGGDGCGPTCGLEVPSGMTLVPAGSFWMGCNDPPSACSAAELPVHLVQLRGFWIDIDEVSVARYTACVTAGACTAPFAFNAGFAALASCNYGRLGAGPHPVNCLTHDQAATFCAWAGGRLPTDAEWEKAARGGCETLPGQDCKIAMRRYPWGQAAPTCVHAVMDSTDPTCGGEGTTLPVGGRDAGKSPYGVRDMLGNVAEWTSDWYDKQWYGKSPASDPMGPGVSTGSHGFRGGAYSYAPSVLRAAMRFNFAATAHRDSRVGMRCARDLLTADKAP